MVKSIMSAIPSAIGANRRRPRSIAAHGFEYETRSGSSYYEPYLSLDVHVL